MISKLLALISGKALPWIIGAVLLAFGMLVGLYLDQSADLRECTERVNTRDETIAARDHTIQQQEAALRGFSEQIKRQNDGIQKLVTDGQKRVSESDRELAELRRKNSAENKATRDRVKVELARSPTAGETCDSGVKFVRSLLKR